MSQYKVDRTLLESHSTADIQRILREERDDYTPEALRIFEEILEERGASQGTGGRERTTRAEMPIQDKRMRGEEMIRDPSDAVRVLNGLLAGVLDGSVDLEVAQAASNVVMAILRALEQEYMTGSEEQR